jgi:MHS family proline/betaine transporter-like MFS transporter
MNRAEKSKIIISCLSGSVLEWFDFAIYGYLAPIIATQFFPAENIFTSLLLTYTVFAIGFIVRPAGAIFFGAMGDKIGRKTALIFSTMLMAIPTLCIGILPNYSTIGIAAPILLVLCRVVQGFSLGGEYAGAFIYLVEKGLPGKKAFFSCWADVGCAAGMILGSLFAALLYAVFNTQQLYSYGWRIPFISGILLSFIAWYMRRQLNESPEFQSAQKIQAAPFKVIFQQFPRIFIFSCLLLSIGSLGYYLVTVFIPNQMVVLGKLGATRIYLLNTLTLSAVIIGILASARLSDIIQPAKIYMIGAISCILFSYPIFYALIYWGLGAQLFLLCSMGISIGFCYGPRPLFLASLFPAGLRYSAIALAISIANAVFGGMGPLVATWMVKRTGMIEAPAFLLMFSGLLSILSIVVLASYLKKNSASKNQWL